MRISAFVDESWFERRLVFAFELGDDARREHLAQLDSPLIERVDAPDDALSEDAVLVQRDERAEDVGREHLGEDHVRRAVALHHAVGHDALRGALGPHLVDGLAEPERFGLREDVRRQDVVVVADRVERLAEADQVDRDQLRALVDQLVEAVLPVRARLTPVHRAGLVVDVSARRG